MRLRNLLFAGAAMVALGGGSVAFAADEQSGQPRSQLNTIRPMPAKDLAQIGDDGMPASADEKAQREEQPRDMSPQTELAGKRLAQSEKPGDQHMTTPLPPTTGSEASAVTLSQVAEPDRTLINAPVEDKSGRKIGEVAQVKLDANGKASEVVLNDRNGTRLAAGELVYQPERGVLITQLSPSDLAPARGSAPADAPPRATAPNPDGN